MNSPFFSSKVLSNIKYLNKTRATEFKKSAAQFKLRDPFYGDTITLYFKNNNILYPGFKYSNK